MELGEHLRDISRHHCLRCDARVQNARIDPTADGGAVFTARCHGEILRKVVSRSVLEDSKRIEYAEPLPAPSDVKLSEHGALVFALVAGLDELLDQRLVTFVRGALLPSLTKRGRERRDERQGAGDDV